MRKERRQFSAKFKFQVALEALKELKTINEIASAHEVGIAVFDDKADKVVKAQTEKEATLYEQIGRLQVELDCTQRFSHVCQARM